MRLVARVGTICFAVVISACSLWSGVDDVQIVTARLLSSPGPGDVIRAAQSASDRDGGQIVVAIRRADVMEMAREEIYGRILVYDCTNEDVSYPAHPYIDQVSLHDFANVVRSMTDQDQDEIVEIRGMVHSNFLRRVHDLCVRVEGGSYLRHRVRSNSVQVAR